MPGQTANQGFSFALSVDSPCAWPTTQQLLTSQVEAKSAGVDFDVARVATPNMVKISKSNITPPITGLITFDTVEFNRGTPTDLSVYNGVLLNPGYWITGGEAQILEAAAGNGATKYLNGGNNGAVGFATSDRAANGYNLTVEGAYTYINGPGPWPNQAVGASTLTYISAPNTRIRFVPSGNFTDGFVYVQMWAFQIGDL